MYNEGGIVKLTIFIYLFFIFYGYFYKNLLKYHNENRKLG